MVDGAMRAAGRPRDLKVDAALLRATQDLLLEQGFDRLSVEAVASRAGVGKAAIYRRWPGKTALVVAAVADLYHVPPVPDTGDLREDLLSCARTYVHQGRTQAVLAGLMTAMVHEDELRIAATEAIGSPYTALFHQVIARAVDRREVPLDVDVTSVSEVFPALAFHRATALGLAIDEEMVVRVVDRLLLPLLR